MLRLTFRMPYGNLSIRFLFISTKLKENQDINNDQQSTESTNDQYTKEFLSNRIQLTELQKFILSAGSSIAALVNPHRQDMIACLGETTGIGALEKIYEQMEIDSEGAQILFDKPRINSKTIDIDALGTLKEDSFGYLYYRFLKDNNVTPDSRLNVRFMDDPKLAYVMTRYRETHDMLHTVFGMPTHMLGEVTVKWVEAINNGLPMCFGAAIFGAVRLRPKHRKLYINHYLPWALKTGRTVKPLLNIYWEKRWEQNIENLRHELNIKTLNIFKPTN